MSNTVPPTIPPGWYSDPADATQLRWWNGSAWSQHVQQRPQPSEIVAEAAPAAAAPAVVAPTVVDSTVVAPTVVETAVTVPAVAAPNEAPLTETSLRSSTVSSWFIALSPFYFAIAFIVALPTVASTTGMLLLAAIAAGIVVLPVVIILICAIVDFGALKKRGLSRPASPGWIFLTPLVYLIVRTVRVRRATGRGSAPLWVWIAAWAVSSAIIGIAAVQIVPAVTNFQNSSSLAQGIQDGMNSQGGKFTVTCPPTAPLTVGSTFTCTALDKATQTSHSLVIDVVAGTNGQPTVQLKTVTPPIAP